MIRVLPERIIHKHFQSLSWQIHYCLVDTFYASNITIFPNMSRKQETRIDSNDTIEPAFAFCCISLYIEVLCTNLQQIIKAIWDLERMRRLAESSYIQQIEWPVDVKGLVYVRSVNLIWIDIMVCFLGSYFHM